MKQVVAFILSRIYGVRGALKPPLGGTHAGRFYTIRYRWRRVMDRLYRWSGLPARWAAWMTNGEVMQ